MVIESFNFSSRIDFGATDFLDTVELCQIIFIYIYILARTPGLSSLNLTLMEAKQPTLLERHVWQVFSTQF